MASTQRRCAKARSSAAGSTAGSRTSTATGMPMTVSTRCRPAHAVSTTARPVDRRLQRLAVAAARVRGTGDDVDLRAAGAQRLLAQDRLRARVDRLRPRPGAGDVDRLDARQLVAG